LTSVDADSLKGVASNYGPRLADVVIRRRPTMPASAIRDDIGLEGLRRRTEWLDGAWPIFAGG
jgi:hypothetical protein